MKLSTRLACVFIAASAVLAIVLDADARRGKRIQIAFGGSGIGDWEDPENEVFVADDQNFGPIILRGSDSVPGDVLDLPMPLQVGIGTDFIDRLWINENGYIVLGTEQTAAPSPFDPDLASLADYPGDIIAPFYADFATTNTPGDGCRAGSGGECDVAYGVLSMNDPDVLDGLDIDYLKSFRVTWGVFERDEFGSVVDSLGLPAAGTNNGLLNRVQMHLIDRHRPDIADPPSAEGDFDIRFYYGGIDWETPTTHIGFKLGPYLLDFSKFYNASRTHDGFLGERIDCLDIGNTDLIDAYVNPEERYPCNIVKVEFRGGKPELVGYTSDLLIQLDDPVNPVNATESFFVNATLENKGPEDETSVVMELTLPPGSSLMSVVTPQNYVCDPNANNTGVSCNIGDVAAMAPAIALSLELRSDEDGLQRYTVSATGDRFDPDLINSTASIEPDIGPTTDLSLDSCVVSSASIPVVVGDSVSLQCTVQNDGPQDATDVQITSTLPPFVTFGSSNQCQASGQSVSCSIASIAQGAQGAANLTLNAVAIGDEMVDVDIPERQGVNDPDLTNNSGEFRAVVLARQLTVAASRLSVPNRTVGDGTSNVAVLRYRLSSNTSDVLLRTLTVSASGRGNDAVDVARIRVWLDANSNGNVDSGEQELGEGRFASDNGSLEITLTQPLQLPMGDTDFLVTYDF